jgi:ribonucleoside-diphosphate reductase alpha chain
MAAVQPFLSGAISKTVNVPTNATVEDMMELYITGWKFGLKALAVYRDGCKRTQPLNTGRDVEKKAALGIAVDYRPVRRKLPNERKAITHKFSIAGHDGYITAGMYDDGSPGEIFMVMAKEGSVVSGLVDAFATSVSLALQYGVPIQVLCDKFTHTRFEPSGFTGNPEIPIAKSIMDYVFRWLDLRFGDAGHAKLPEVEASVTRVEEVREERASMVASRKDATELEHAVFTSQADAPPCHACGSIMVRSGACYKCFNCGATSGCS